LIELLIIGDSLSAPDACQWSKHMAGESAYVRNIAQSGLTLRDFDLPDYIRGNPTMERRLAVVYIGVNDIGQKLDSGQYRFKLQELVLRLNHRGFETYVIKMPLLFDFMDGVVEYNAKIDTIKGANIIDPGWNSNATEDGVHPTCPAHYYLSLWFKQQLKIGD